jgi:hypothetical protein
VAAAIGVVWVFMRGLIVAIQAGYRRLRVLLNRKFTQYLMAHSFAPICDAAFT